MLNYVNGFTCTAHNERNEIVIHFLQNEPVITDDGTIVNQVNQISSIIMTTDIAKGLSDSILEVLEKQAEIFNDNSAS